MSSIAKLTTAAVWLGASLAFVSTVTAQQNLSDQGYDNVQSFEAAVAVVREQLKLDGKVELAGLITNERVRDAIRTAIRDIDALMRDADERIVARKTEWQREIKPACLKMVDEGHWPAGSTFNGFYRLNDGGNEHEGLGLRLNVVTPTARFNALPIADVWFGKVPK